MLAWRISERPGFTRVELQGEIDDGVDLAALARRLAGPVRLHLGEVRQVSPLGLRGWLAFVRGLPRVTELVFTHCSPPVVDMLGVLSTFRGAGRVRSFLAPHRCAACGREEDKLVDVALDLGGGAGPLPRFACAGCGQPLALDALPGRYLAFLGEGAA